MPGGGCLAFRRASRIAVQRGGPFIDMSTAGAGMAVRPLLQGSIPVSAMGLIFSAPYDVFNTVGFEERLGRVGIEAAESVAVERTASSFFMRSEYPRHRCMPARWRRSGWRSARGRPTVSRRVRTFSANPGRRARRTRSSAIQAGKDAVPVLGRVTSAVVVNLLL